MQVSLPRAVLEAERKADEALQRLQAARQPQQAQAEVTPPADSQTPTPAVASEAPAPAPESTAPTNTPPTEGDEKWESRYKTLNGKYNAEVPRLHAALKERDSKLNSLTDEVEALKAKVEAQNREPLVKPEEVNEYGEPLVDLIRRAAREEVSTKDAEIKELSRKLDRMSTQTVETQEVSFYDKLNAAVSDWMTINNEPEFHAWLGEIDELTGVQRQAILSEAEEKRDADRVARFFNAYKRVQETKAANARVSLESQTVPVTSRVDAPPQGKKLWTRAEIADHYAKDRRGEYTEEQAMAIENEIQAAIREGRIR